MNEEDYLFDLFEREEDINDNTADERFERDREDRFSENENKQFQDHDRK